MTTHILVVDDSPIEQRLVGRLLEKGLTDVAVTYAANGKEAFDAISAAMPEMVISDLRMPLMNGLELVENIKASGFGVPVILMTSYGNEEIAVKALQTGAASYVPKLARDKILIETVENILSMSRGQRNRRRVLSTLDSVESRFVLGNDVSLITPLIDYLQEQIGMLRLYDDLQMTRIAIAICESLTNAIYHGNLELDSELRQEDESDFHRLAEQRRREAPYADRRVRMTATMSSEVLRIAIHDDGPGFDPNAVLNPTEEVNMDRIGGRGLLLIRSFMDEVSHNSKGNEVTLTKHAAPRSPTT